MKRSKLFRLIMAACLTLGLAATADVAQAGSRDRHKPQKKHRRQEAPRYDVHRIPGHPYNPHVRPRHQGHRRSKHPRHHRYMRGQVVVDLGALTLILPPPPLPPLPPPHHRR